MANVDPTSALVSLAVNEVIVLAKSAIHCKEKCSKLEDSMAKASVVLGELHRYSHSQVAESSVSSSQLDAWLKSLKSMVEEAKPLVLECQSLQNPIRDFPRRITLATKIEKCSEEINKHLAAGSLNLGLEILSIITSKKQKGVPSNVVPKEEQHVVPMEDQIFGMEETLAEVISHLLGSKSKWVGVHGVGGAGKTLLAKRVSGNEQVKGHFDPVLWLTFGQSCQVEAKQGEFAKQIDLGGQISNETLRTGLAGKRCLLVLDDVWKAGDLDLFDVVQDNGSRIFITTRKVNVLDSRGATKTEMGLLGKEDSLKLFTVHAFPNQRQAQNQGSKVVVQQVVEKCGGLPLVLKVIGRRMAGRDDWDYVLSKLNDHNLATLDEEEQVLQRLKLGYDALLPLGIQQHFLFFAAFPEDWPIRFWDLFRCWKGEGLVADIPEARNVLERLKDHALITEEDYNLVEGWLIKKAYRIHDALLALALHILEQEGPKCYFKAGQQLQIRDIGDAFTSSYRMISLIWCGISEEDITLPKKKSVSSTTSLLLDDNPHLTALPNLSRFKSLKVLCLRHTGVVTLPHSIGHLKNLETLDLSWNQSLQSIPGSLGMLTRLSYLDVAGCYELKSFPVDALLKLTRLTYFNGYFNRSMWQWHRHHLLSSLERCLFDYRRTEQLHLGALTKLEVLHIKIDSNLDVELPESIGNLSYLKEFSIDGPITKVSTNLQYLTNLETLILEGLRFPLSSDWDWSKFFRLRTLRLASYTLTETEFKVTSSMENLEVLDIGGHHLEVPFLTQEKFPMLADLYIWGCEKVPTISKLASLKFIKIMSCLSLKELSISFLPNLEVLYLCYCETAFLNISECPSLKHVKVYDFNSLGHIAFGGKFPQFHTISLRRLKKVPDVSLDPCARLQLTELDIRQCGISHLPEWCAQFTTLRYLTLRELEDLEVIPDGVARLPLLRKLNLRGCKKIRTLPFTDSEDSSFYPSLEKLFLYGTSISQEHLSQRLRQVSYWLSVCQEHLSQRLRKVSSWEFGSRHCLFCLRLAR